MGTNGPWDVDFFQPQIEKIMKNIDIIILNGIVIICFITFFISTFKAFEKNTVKKNPVVQQRGIISRFLAYLQSLFND